MARRWAGISGMFYVTVHSVTSNTLRDAQKSQKDAILRWKTRDSGVWTVTVLCFGFPDKNMVTGQCDRKVTLELKNIFRGFMDIWYWPYKVILLIYNDCGTCYNQQSSRLYLFTLWGGIPALQAQEISEITKRVEKKNNAMELKKRRKMAGNPSLFMSWTMGIFSV